MALFAQPGKTQILRVKLERGNGAKSRDEVMCGSVEALFRRLGGSPNGVTSSEASARLTRFGANRESFAAKLP